MLGWAARNRPLTEFGNGVITEAKWIVKLDSWDVPVIFRVNGIEDGRLNIGIG